MKKVVKFIFLSVIKSTYDLSYWSAKTHPTRREHEAELRCSILFSIYTMCIFLGMYYLSNFRVPKNLVIEILIITPIVLFFIFSSIINYNWIRNIKL